MNRTNTLIILAIAGTGLLAACGGDDGRPPLPSPPHQRRPLLRCRPRRVPPSPRPGPPSR